MRFSTPFTCTDQWSLLGLTNQLSTSTDKTAALLEPLHPLLSTKNGFAWTANHDITLILPSSEPILMCPHPLVCAQVQAGGYGLGFIPQQQLPYKDNSTFVIDSGCKEKVKVCSWIERFWLYVAITIDSYMSGVAKFCINILYWYLYICVHIDEPCCTEPDIFTVDIDCTTKELSWTSSREASFGFCYYYQCSSDDNVDYCNGLQQVAK